MYLAPANEVEFAVYGAKEIRKVLRRRFMDGLQLGIAIGVAFAIAFLGPALWLANHR